MTPKQELIYNIIRKKGPLTLTKITEIVEKNSTGNVPILLSKLEQQGFIRKRRCPTCDKDGLYEAKHKRPLSSMPAK